MPEDLYDETSGSRTSRGGGRGRGRDPYNILLIMLAGVMLLVAARLVWFQVIRHDELTEEALKNRSVPITLQAKRGTIYDRNGNVLAMSEDCSTVTCNPKEIEQPYRTAEVIAAHLGGDTSDYVDALTGDGVFAYVYRKADTDKATAMQEDLASLELPGVFLEPDTRRVYPYGAIGSQVLGIVDADGKGLTGLELYYDDVLSGTNGEMMLERGAYGTPMVGASTVTTEAIDGTDIVISLDINVQRVSEENIVEGVKEYKADSGSVMVTDPRTGEILAACSTPLFDITDLSVVEEGATSIKVVTDSYEPGSIFKILTASIGIEQGVVDSASHFYVPWQLEVGDDLVTDDDGRDYDMDMSLREILRRSSNTGAALIAQEEIGADAFAEGVSAFGIGQMTGIDYPGEVPGLVKSRDEYDGSSVGSMSFGQGLAIPLVQMVRAVGAVGNHGVPITPHFLVRKGPDAVDWAAGDPIISENTSREVVDMMRTVVEEGTGVPAQVEGYDVAGKTGTGERADTTKGGYIEDKFTSSLIGFAPAADPSVLVYVGLNGTPYLASASAAPLFSSIMGEALTDMGVLPAM